MADPPPPTADRADPARVRRPGDGRSARRRWGRPSGSARRSTPARPPTGLDFAPLDPRALLVYLGALGLVHLLFVLAGRRTDQVLLPAAGMLGGIGLLLMQRLPQGLVTQSFFGTELMLAQVQLVWLVIALTIVTVLALAIRSDAWLRTYKYTWAAAGIALLLATFVLGSDVNGARLTLSIGPLSGQPSELLKVILVVFLAGYLSENRSLLADENTQVGPFKLPPIPYLAPMVAMVAIALSIVVVQRDLGAALLFFAVFLALLYVATGRLVVRARRAGPVPRRLDRPVQPVRPRPAAGRQLARPVRATRSASGSRPSRRCTRSPAAGCSAWGSATACRRSAAGCRSPPSTPTTRSRRWARSWASSACSRSSACISS